MRRQQKLPPAPLATVMGRVARIAYRGLAPRTELLRKMPPSPLSPSKRGLGAGSGAVIPPVTSFEGPERMVGFGFRLWLNGFRTGDISSWEEAWSAYAGTIGAAAARTAVGQLSCWV